MHGCVELCKSDLGMPACICRCVEHYKSDFVTLPSVYAIGVEHCESDVKSTIQSSWVKGHKT